MCVVYQHTILELNHCISLYLQVAKYTDNSETNYARGCQAYNTTACTSVLQQQQCQDANGAEVGVQIAEEIICSIISSLSVKSQIIP